MDVITLAVAKKYTKDSAQGMYFNDTVCNLSLRGVTPISATNAECKVLVTYIIITHLNTN